MKFPKMSPWLNRLPRSAVNRKFGGSSAPRDGSFCFNRKRKNKSQDISINFIFLFSIRKSRANGVHLTLNSLGSQS